MTHAVRASSEDVRAFIFAHLRDGKLASRVAEKFSISRQVANRHLQTLVSEGFIIADGRTKSRTYKLASTLKRTFSYQIEPGLEEDYVWRSDIKPLLSALPSNVLQIWHFAFTEMFNNAVDHSEGKKIIVAVEKTAVDTEIMLLDDGVGIFQKLQDEFQLEDKRHAVFELSKGKLTTDPRNHSGQGIFFTSRMVNKFTLISEGAALTHNIGEDEDWLIENDRPKQGTSVFLKVNNHTARTTRKIFNQFNVPGSYGFNKTVVPVELARYGSDQLVSRSQAKRVLARVDQFSQVVFDFSGVEEIGQAFADQIFRVFASEHPNIKLFPVHANKRITALWREAIKAGRPGYKGKISADSKS